MTDVTEPLVPVGSIDLSTTLNSGQAFRWKRDHTDSWTGFIQGKLVRLLERDGKIWVQSGDTGFVKAVEEYLSLGIDLGAIQSRLSNDQHVADGIHEYPGMRILRQDPWETLASFILSSTSNIPRISRTVEAIADRFGIPQRVGDSTRNAFPSADILSLASERKLRDLGCGFRAPYLLAAAQAVATDRIHFGDLRQATYDEAREWLVTLRGVGDKIADCVMLFSLDKPMAFPVDRWVLRVVHECYGLSERTKYDEIRNWSWGRFGNDAGYANQYLFWRVRQSNRIRMS